MIYSASPIVCAWSGRGGSPARRDTDLAPGRPEGSRFLSSDFQRSMLALLHGLLVSSDVLDNSCKGNASRSSKVGEIVVLKQRHFSVLEGSSVKMSETNRTRPYHLDDHETLLERLVGPC